MKTTTIDGTLVSIHPTKTQNGTIDAGCAYVPVLDDGDVLEQFQALIDDGHETASDIRRRYRSGCAVDLQSRVRNAASAKWNDKLIGSYWSRVDTTGSYESIVQRCKDLFKSDCIAGTNVLTHITPWGNVDMNADDTDDTVDE